MGAVSLLRIAWRRMNPERIAGRDKKNGASWAEDRARRWGMILAPPAKGRGALFYRPGQPLPVPRCSKLRGMWQ